MLSHFHAVLSYWLVFRSSLSHTVHDRYHVMLSTYVLDTVHHMYLIRFYSIPWRRAAILCFASLGIISSQTLRVASVQPAASPAGAPVAAPPLRRYRV